MAAHFHLIRDGVTVIERGWLNCNQIVLTAPDHNVVVDSGYGRHADSTLSLINQALNGAPVHWLINTHCHSDHMGGNRALRERDACRVTIPEGEVAHIKPWTSQSCWAEDTDQYAEPFEFDDTIAAGHTFSAGGLTWLAIAAPGHDMGALIFWCEQERILISGDALWERGLGFVWPEKYASNHIPRIDKPNHDNTSIDDASSSIGAAFGALATIEALQPRLVIPGHGAPFTDVNAALQFSRSRLSAFANDPAKNARQIVKSLFVFSLLDKGEMALSALPSYLASVPVHRRMNDGFLNMSYADLAVTLLKDLTANGAVVIDHSAAEPNIRPAMRA